MLQRIFLLLFFKVTIYHSHISTSYPKSWENIFILQEQNQADVLLDSSINIQGVLKRYTMKNVISVLCFMFDLKCYFSKKDKAY